MKRTDKFTLSIVTPMFNEELNVDVFYEEILKNIKLIEDLYSYEIICVNDGSADKTFQKLETLHNKDNKLKVIDLSRNFGQQIALTAGLDFATGDIIIPIDADLQDPPDLIPKMIEKWKEGYDVVYGVRVSRDGETNFKKFTAYMFYLIISKISGVNIPRNTGDFRLIDKKVLNAIKELKETQRFMKGIFAWVGFNSIGIEYARKPRNAGKTKWNYFKLINLAIEGITSFSNIPLKISFYFGILISLSSIFYALYIFVMWVLHGNDVAGYTSLMLVILFCSGIQLFSIGLIGEYIGRNYAESKRRPLYFTKNILGYKDN